MQGAGSIVRTRNAGRVSDDVDARQQAFQRCLCRVGGLGQVVAQMQDVVRGADGATKNAHARISQCAEIDGATVRPAHELKRRQRASAV